jgi:folate-binding protein YgfZ
MPNLAILLEDRGVIAAGGPECRDFLQNIITNDVDRLAPETALYSALLTPQGKYLYDFILVDQGDALLIDVHSTPLADFLRKLMMYRLRADVSLEDTSENWNCYALLGEVPALAEDAGACMAHEGGYIYRDPRSAKLGARAILPTGTAEQTIAALGFEIGLREDYETRRITLGVVDGQQDLEEERTLLLEANFDRLNGVVFNKGCYVGQEQTARTKHRATIRNRFYPIEFSSAAPEIGSPVEVDGKDVGKITSVAGSNGIARLKVEQVESGAPLSVSNQPITINTLDL